jgi:hypothetical protein
MQLTLAANVVDREQVDVPRLGVVEQEGRLATDLLAFGRPLVCVRQARQLSGERRHAGYAKPGAR